jgi:hypothetical protein
MKKLKLALIVLGLAIGSSSYAQLGNGQIRFWSSNLTNSTMGIDNIENMYGLGYRFSLLNLRVGIDLGMSKKDKNKDGINTDCTKYLIMPAVEINFINLGIINFYIAGNAGYMWSKYKYDDSSLKNVKDKEFAYQVSPLCARIKLGPIGAFIECGYGHKGLISGGITMKF